MLVIILKSLIVGAVAGFGVGAGAARMFFAPKVQAAGAFRTIATASALPSLNIFAFLEG